MFKIIFLLILIMLTGCDKLSVDKRKDKVFPMSVSDISDSSGTLLERRELDLSSLILDKSVYEVIERRYREQTLGNITELVDIALNEERMVEFLKEDSVAAKMNTKINIEVRGEVKYTYMLHLALEYNFYPSTIELMLNKGALLLKDSGGNTPIFIAVDKRQNELLSVMVQFARDREISIDEKIT